MKILVGSIIGLIGSAVVIFFNIQFLKWIFTLVPQSDYTGLIKIGVVFIDFWFTAGLCILPFVLGLAICSSLEE